jgi:3-deoxy-D-manno-octulosonate 8-phosphate phosphatase (KDO 8-P phosphatase)
MNNAPADCAWFKHCLSDTQLCKTLASITLVMCDIDGALTDGGIYVSPQGEGGRIFSVQDGYIVKPAMRAGITIACISGKNNRSALERCKTLGIPEDLCFAGLESKLETVKLLQKKLNINSTQSMMYGDDFLDAEVKHEGHAVLYACPSNTPFYFQSSADLVIPRSGGSGAFRLLMDLVLFVRGQHFAQQAIKNYLEAKEAIKTI